MKTLCRRPPCEVVNWKKNKLQTYQWLHKSTSLWGRELKAFWPDTLLNSFGRPPCEVVNWKADLQKVWEENICRPPCEVVNWKEYTIQKTICLSVSTSLWGRELKDFLLLVWSVRWLVDLLVRSWIESLLYREQENHKQVDLLVRSWIERFEKAKFWVITQVDLLVRSWIERLLNSACPDLFPVDLLVRSWIER